ncbi:NERD domain-containing protein [Clostridium perfringens]|uniref:NERD domain-containing protein n=1 Tax=Clostridium perfringens TaxID=1502 RepID=UPI002972F086|nr:NERD domain-containing protein [Clostridium perfringens]MDM0476157.1 NERD domain-containing protein [Clostridium perfringens]MDM0481638.1 NERD domain-containing protein [Clostridium perfringens]MDM0483421.1 NERD domain-containing protein [Clostridium perfringens]MDM0485703.1 NERD domain-containing protein [Clostridium perfringens]
MLKEIIFGISSIKGPTWLKEFNENNKQLEDLKILSEKVYGEKKKLIDRDIMYLTYGMEGEKNVSYEIKNSYIPMLALHDIRIEDGESVAQMDYILITKSFILVLETKALSGDVTVNESGEFIRYFKNKAGKVYRKEGIYSPVAQNERHVRILTEYLKKNKIIKKYPIYSCVVIANSKSVINKYKAPKEIQSQIIKYDQLTSFIKEKLNYHKIKQDFKFLDKVEYSIGKFLLENNKPIEFDYYKKYSLSEEDFIKKDSEVCSEEKVNNDDVLLNGEDKTYEVKILNNKNEEELRRKLKQLRINFAIKEKLPPYCIFNDETLNDILDKMPKNKEELMKVKGLAKVKVNKYGEEILGVLK